MAKMLVGQSLISTFTASKEGAVTPPPAGATPGEELYQKGQIWGLSERLQLRGHAGGAVAMEQGPGGCPIMLRLML